MFLSMKKHISRIIKHPLISGGSIIFVGSFVANILNYVFNLLMGRLLPVSEYGILISLVALVTLLTLFQSSFTTLFAKFSAKYSATGNTSGLSSLVWSGTKITGMLSLCSLVVLIVLIIPISQFLHINSPFVIGVMLFSIIFAVLYSLPAGILQGKLKFFLVSCINILGALSKLLLGFVLVSLGMGVMGGAIAILFAFCVPYVLSYAYVLKKYKINTHKEGNVKFLEEFKKVSGPFLFASAAITILQGTDVIFARHFLNSIEAGQYAALSVMGKAIFYITAPIYFAFFPLIAQKKEKSESTVGTLMLASGIIFACSLFFTLVYFIFPELIIRIFFPSPAYSILSSYLGLYSLYVMVFSLCFLLFNYFLSIGRLGIYKISWSAAIIYIILLYFFHSNIMEFILVLISSSLLLLFMLCIYYMKRS